MRTPFPLIAALFVFCNATLVSLPTASLTQRRELEINLNDPVFKEGVLTTDRGGVVIGEALRIQAGKVTYINRIEEGLPVKKIIAEENLLVEYAGKAFVGKKLEFNFLTRTGTVWEGKTYIDVWFIGGEKIELRADGSYHIHHAFLTTSEDSHSLWDIHAGQVNITKDHFLAANNIRVRFSKFPIFWLPSFKANLRFFKDPPVRYKIVWDKGLGPRATMRYRIYSWNDLNLYLRLDYRLKRGFGGALESEYFSPDGRTAFVTKSYGAHDKSIPDQEGPRRFRLQGLLDSRSESGKTLFHMTWDKLHDSKMPGDFRSEDFEINTQKQTILWIHHLEKNAFATLRFQPRINSFQSLNQELPLLHFGIKPFVLGKTGIISQNNAKAAFLDYVFDKTLRAQLPSRHAIRLETQNQLYRPLPLGPFTLTPHAGIVAIFYNNNPFNQSIGQSALSYGADLNTRLYRQVKETTHEWMPYARFDGLSKPLAQSDDVIIFSLQDGYSRLEQLRLGIKNSLFTKGLSPTFALDLFTYGFFAGKSFHRTFPKAYAAANWNLPSCALYACTAWNFRNRLLDFFNIRSLWTVSETFAIALEFRHRSRFDFRKADHENFILDSERPLSELLHSPLSDGRNTFLSHLYFYLSPRWTCHFESHQGWGRRDDPSYTAARIELFTLLTTSWRLKISVERTPNNFRFGGGISLVK